MIWKTIFPDERVLRGIILINRNGLRWQDAPIEYGPPKTLYNRWVRRGRLGVFARMLNAMTFEGQVTGTVTINATHLKAHRTASSLRGKKGAKRFIGLTKGGLNFKLHMVTDAEGHPICLYPGAGHPLGDARVACQATDPRLDRSGGAFAHLATDGCTVG